MQRSIRPKFNAEDDDQDLEQLQREFFEKKTQPSASVVRGGPPPTTTKKSIFAQRRQATKKEEEEDGLASMPALETVDLPGLEAVENNDMPPLEAASDANTHQPVSKKMLDLTSLLGNILGDVTENTVDKVEAPKLTAGTERSKQHVQGFPKPARRSLFKMRMDASNNPAKPSPPPPPRTATKSNADYGQDNMDRIANMSEAEIEAARKEIMESLSEDSIAMLMKRKDKKEEDEDQGEEDLMVMKERYFADVPTEYEKLAWMDSRFDIKPQEQKEEGEMTESDKLFRRTRFDFQGNPVDPSKDLPVHQGLHHHGDEPDKAGYTLAELFHLVRSQVAPQRTMVLNTLTRILRNGKMNRGVEFWDKVLALFLRPDLACTIYLRSAMDDRHLVVLVSAVQAMAALVLEKGDESDEDASLDVEQFNEYLGYVARPQIKADEHIKGLGENFAATVDQLRGTQEEDEEPEDDAQLAQRDLTQGLLQMDILQRIRYLTSENSELDSNSIEQLVRILIRFARSGAEVCEKIMDHDLLDQILNWGLLHRDWPMTEDDDGAYPSVAAVRLMTILAQGIRQVAEQINAKATCLLQYLATSPAAASAAMQRRAYALQVETLKLLRVLICYGLVMPALQDLHEPMMAWLRAGLTSNELDDARAATTISLLEISLHAAADPHRTTPPHAIDWHQPTAFIPVILAIMRTREPSMVLDSALGYFATLAGYIDRFPRVDDTISTADIWKVTMERSIVRSRSNSILRYVQLLSAFSTAKTFESDALVRLENAVTLVKPVHNRDFLGRLAMYTWASHVKERCVRIRLWGDGYDAAELETTVGSAHVGILESQLAQNLVQLCVLERLDSKLASILALFYLGDSKAVPLLLDHNGPRLQTLVYPEQQDASPSVTAWVFSPIDEVYHMDKSRIAQTCTYSSAEVVAATLEAAAVLLEANVDYDVAVVSLMKIFMINDKVFWDDRVTCKLDHWLDLICQRPTDAGSLEAAWRRSSAHIRQPFYQFYQAFVAQYASVSFGHAGFARLLAYVATQPGTIDYKYLLWSDYRDVLPTIKVKPEELCLGRSTNHSSALLRAYMAALAENKVEGAMRQFAVNELSSADVPGNLKRDIDGLLNKQ